MESQKVIIFALLLLLPLVTDAARILGVIPLPSKSHHAVVHALLRELANRGHHVTALEFYPPSQMPHNYTHVELQDTFLKNVTGSSNMWNMPSMSYVSRVLMLWGLGSALVDNLFQQPNVQAIINSKEHFDLLIVESFFNEAFLGFAHRFNAPIVQVCPYVGSFWMYDTVGSPSPTSYVPDPFLSYGDTMTFLERFINGIYGVFQAVGRKLFYIPKQDAIMRKWFNASEPIPYLSEIESSTSLMLVNSHISLNYPRPSSPGLISVGAMHIQPAKELPNDLKTLLEKSEDGVIFFSMGSALQSALMPEDNIKALLEVFQTLKQRVLWKWENDTLPGKSPNVEIRKWFPQADILAHPNVRAFITHGGLLSSLEAVYHGVPLVGIPVFGDQQLNMEKAENAGYGVKIDYTDLNSENLKSALNKVLNNKSYQENVRLLSKILKDQPETPLERAVWWTEYVLRHKGAPQMQSAVSKLKWYQQYQLDVILVIVTVVCFILGVSIKIFLYLKLLVFSKAATKKVRNELATKKRK